MRAPKRPGRLAIHLMRAPGLWYMGALSAVLATLLWAGSTFGQAWLESIVASIAVVLLLLLALLRALLALIFAAYYGLLKGTVLQHGWWFIGAVIAFWTLLGWAIPLGNLRCWLHEDGLQAIQAELAPHDTETTLAHVRNYLAQRQGSFIGLHYPAVESPAAWGANARGVFTGFAAPLAASFPMNDYSTVEAADGFVLLGPGNTSFMPMEFGLAYLPGLRASGRALQTFEEVWPDWYMVMRLQSFR